MPSSLLTAASGLLAHQNKLDVVANNLANLNTIGYKSQNIQFADLIYSTFKQATNSLSTSSGGTNPSQVGNGVQVAVIARNNSQGVLNTTGGDFDFAIEGEGYFVVENGQQLYTRDGSFSLDSNGFLVDPATGAFVQRYGVTGEGLDGNPQFQEPGDARIRVPLGIGIAGKGTEAAEFAGNLPKTLSPPVAEVLVSSTPYTTGGSPSQLTDTLNSLDSSQTPYQAGDTVEISGTDVDGSSFSSTFSVDATTTLGDLINEINSNMTGATASLDASGNLVVTANQPGEALLSLQLEDGAGNAGQMDFGSHNLVVETDGDNGGVVESTVQVFDSRGVPHAINAKFQKRDDNTWDATFEVGDGSGTMIDARVDGIVFNEDGSFKQITGTGEGDANIEIQFDSVSSPQTIELSFDRFTHIPTDFASTFSQDGFPPGTLAAVDVSNQGVVSGVATNGRRVPIAQLAIATFTNSYGLEGVGQNYYASTANSGNPQIGAGLTNGAGLVRGGQLEASNVDVAQEFTQLIVAQRGFSANARTITVASDVLEELTNLIR